MSAAAAPHFWAAPLRYCRWAARERPALFWSVIIGAAGPVAMPFAAPIRRALGDVDPAAIPVTYPGTYTWIVACAFWSCNVQHMSVAERSIANCAVTVPTGPRKQLTGYDDE